MNIKSINRSFLPSVPNGERHSYVKYVDVIVTIDPAEIPIEITERFPIGAKVHGTIPLTYSRGVIKKIALTRSQDFALSAADTMAPELFDVDPNVA